MRSSRAVVMLMQALRKAVVTRGKRLVVLVGQKKAVLSRCATSRAAGIGRAWRVAAVAESLDTAALTQALNLRPLLGCCGSSSSFGFGQIGRE